MPRKPREKSVTGIYHAMIRGINKQNIFFDTDDFELMQHTLLWVQSHKEMDGRIVYGDCVIYAYCIMNNHLHLLVKEGSLNIAQIMKRIEDRYAIIYNRKYDRVGHLFQDRFRSEPVNDLDYFHVLLRYIHRNPVKGKECKLPEEYPHSSWREYLQSSEVTNVVILPEALNAVDSHFDRHDLVDWVNMDVDDECMDIDNDQFVFSDNQAWTIISDIAQERNPEVFKAKSTDFQLQCLIKAIQAGITIAQAARLSSVSVYTIKKTLDSIKKTSSYSLTLDSTLSCHLKKIETLTNESANNKIRMLKIISMCFELRNIRRTEVSECLVISDSLSRRLLHRLIQLSILQKRGSSKRISYELCN